MSKKANPTLIGVFVVGAMTIAIFAIYFFAKQTLFTKIDKYSLYFPQSINGLDLGSPVKFKGVEIGWVSDILLEFERSSTYVPVIINVPRKKASTETMSSILLNKERFLNEIQKGLRASLGLQSFLTGKYFIELDFFPEEPAVFLGINPPYSEIPTVYSDYEKMWLAIKESFEKISKIDFLSIGNHIKSVAKKFDLKLDELNFKEINDKLIAAMESLRNMSSNIDKHIDPLSSDLKQTLGHASQAFEELKKAATSADNLMSPDAPYGGQINTTLEELSKAARSIRNLSDFLERNPNALLTGRRMSD